MSLPFVSTFSWWNQVKTMETLSQRLWANQTCSFVRNWGMPKSAGHMLTYYHWSWMAIWRFLHHFHTHITTKVKTQRCEVLLVYITCLMQNRLKVAVQLQMPSLGCLSICHTAFLHASKSAAKPNVSASTLVPSQSPAQISWRRVFALWADTGKNSSTVLGFASCCFLVHLQECASQRVVDRLFLDPCDWGMSRCPTSSMDNKHLCGLWIFNPSWCWTLQDKCHICEDCLYFKMLRNFDLKVFPFNRQSDMYNLGIGGYFWSWSVLFLPRFTHE